MAFIHRYFHAMRQIILGFVTNIGFIIAVSCLFMFVEARSPFDDFNYSSQWKRLFYVTLGMLVVMLHLHTRDMVQVRFGNMLCGIALVLSIVWFLARNTVSKESFVWVYGIDVMLCAVLLYSFVVTDNFVTRFFSLRGIVWLGGQLSMYLYMSHYLIRMYLDEIFRLHDLRSLPMMLIETVLILILSFLVSTGLCWIQQHIANVQSRSGGRHGKKPL